MDAHISGTFHLPLWRQETLVKWASLSRAIDAKRRNTISHRKPCKCFYLTPLHHHPHILYTSLLWPTFTPPLLMPLACGVQYCSNLAIFQWCLSASVCSSKTVSTNSNNCKTNSNGSPFCYCMNTVKKRKLNLATNCHYHQASEEPLGTDDEIWWCYFRSLNC